MATVLIRTTVDVDEEVDVDLRDFVDDLEDDEARELLAGLDRVSAQLQQLVWNEIRRAARLGEGEGL
jgi:hypothetical protein